MSRAEERRAYKKDWEEKNKDKVTESKQRWLINNPEKRKEVSKKYREVNKEKARQYILDHYEWYILNSARSRCRIHGITFNITEEDIIIPEVCPYLNKPITRIQGKGRQDYNPSLDRIDPTKGYIKGNIEIISDKANRMKNNATKEELVTFANELLKRYGNCLKERT